MVPHEAETDVPARSLAPRFVMPARATRRPEVESPASVETPTRREEVGTRRALVWCSNNPATVHVAQALSARGWIVDWLGAKSSPWGTARAFDGRRLAFDAQENAEIERLLWDHPLDALFLLGDDQLHWLLARWERLPPHLRRHLAERDAIETALSKHRSMQLAAKLGVPVLETERCTSPDAVQAAARKLGRRGYVVVKGEGGSGGSAVRGLRIGHALGDRDWRAVTRGSPAVMVQRRLQGARMLVTVVYEHGEERAACAHEKVAAWPADFGPAAVGVTRRVSAVHEYTQRMFRALRWHGMADIEFRQDADDGHWYFMEINPRVPATLGIQKRAGIDVVGSWAAVCEGRGSELASDRTYREDVRYGWSTNLIPLAMRQPWKVPAWAWSCLAAGESDLQDLDPALRTRALRLALWFARHPRRN